MPRFYFNVSDGRSVLDTDGVDLTDVARAREEAIRIAGGIIERDASRIAAGGAWSMEVTDSGGQQLFHVDLSIRAA